MILLNKFWQGRSVDLRKHNPEFTYIVFLKLSYFCRLYYYML